MTELMTVAAAVLAFEAGGRSAGRRLWMVIREVFLQRSYRTTATAVSSATVAWVPGCAQVCHVHPSAAVWTTGACSLFDGERERGQGAGG